MPFGLCNKQWIKFYGIKEKFVLVYLDDVIIYSKTSKSRTQQFVSQSTTRNAQVVRVVVRDHNSNE